MFTDCVSIKIIAGKGGNGIVAWRREKYLPKGGPYGGNGGPGGNVVIQGDENIYSLDAFRHQKIIKAESGSNGEANCRQGRTGRNFVIKVPCGTLVKDPKTGVVLCDIVEKNQEETLCLGGRGGRGNASFRSSVKQAPAFCTQGDEGEERQIELELKLIADIGLVGFPNAGKSTLMNALTQSNVKCAAYAFTTLTPNLAYIENDDYRRYFIADIPGIIEGAHRNKGLGLTFLKHIERTKILLFVLDATNDPLHDYQVLCDEIHQYNPKILEKPSFILLNKCDLEIPEGQIESFKASCLNPKVFCISALDQTNLTELRKEIFSLSL